MNCEICGKQIGTTFLNKILGTHVKDAKGAKHVICFDCQKKIPTKEEILKNIK